MKKFLAIILGLVLILTFGAVAMANDTTTPEETETDEELENAVIVDNILTAFPDLTAEQITALTDAGWGYGEIIIAASFATKSGKTMDEILALYEAGAGWGEIAKSLGLPVGKFGPMISAIVSQGKGHKKGKTADPGQEEAALGELVRLNFGQGKKESFEQLRTEYKATHRELIMACVMARAAGDDAALQTALEMRAQDRGWKAIMEQLKVDIKGMTAKDQQGVRETGKAKETGKGKESGQGNGKGN